MYPITVVDGFFDEPDKIVDFAMEQEFYASDDGRWPGKRTKQLWELDRALYDYTCIKILSLFHPDIPPHWEFEITFQLISPFSTHQYDSKNRGLVHVDKGGSLFGGIIYLNKTPEKDTGTSIYTQKKGWSNQVYASLDVKQKFYRGEDVSDEEIEQAWHCINSQYTETMSVENVYNRMLLFNCNTFHGVKTFGKKQDRLTISFFCRDSAAPPPLFR